VAQFFYPPLDPATVKSLLVVRQLVEEHASYFLESPYPQTVEQDLLTLFKKTQKAMVVQEVSQEEIDMELELKGLYTSLKNAKPGATDSDQMAYFRTATALMERLLGLQEKARNMKAMGEHHAMVLNFLEEVCSPTQIEEFLARLKDLK